MKNLPIGCLTRNINWMVNIENVSLLHLKVILGPLFYGLCSELGSMWNVKIGINPALKEECMGRSVG